MLDDNNPTQDNHDQESHISSHHDDEPSDTWGRLISLRPHYSVRPLTEDRIEFGRKASCTIHLKHAAVSGLHCTLINKGSAGVFLTDHSTNGTFVNNVNIGKGKSRQMHHGDEITIIKIQPERITYTLQLVDREKKPLNELEKRYHVGETLGTGAFAVVRHCVDTHTLKEYAVKVIDKKKYMQLSSSKRDTSLMDEVRALQECNHPNIIKLHDYVNTDRYLYLVLELVTGGDLFDRIVAQDGKGFPEEDAKYMFSQLLDAMKYLHQRNIVHRDLKPENILMARKDSLDLRVTDFGLSRVLGEGSFCKTLCGTPQYLAPEVLTENEGGSQPKTRSYDKAVDLWSAGIILYILLSGLAPFSPTHDDPGRLNRCIKAGRYSFPSPHWDRVSSHAKDVVRSLLQVDPTKRMTIEQAERHSWMMKQTKRKATDNGEWERNGSATKRRTGVANANGNGNGGAQQAAAAAAQVMPVGAASV